MDEFNYHALTRFCMKSKLTEIVASIGLGDVTVEKLLDLIILQIINVAVCLIFYTTFVPTVFFCSDKHFNKLPAVYDPHAVGMALMKSVFIPLHPP
jgi:hypothetical protein